MCKHLKKILIFFNFLLIDTFKKAVKTLGGLEILVNNADIMNETDFMKSIDINVVSKNVIFCNAIQDITKRLNKALVYSFLGYDIEHVKISL